MAASRHLAFGASRNSAIRSAASAILQGVLSIRRISILGLGLGIGLGLVLGLGLRLGSGLGFGDSGYGELKFGEMKFGEMRRNRPRKSYPKTKVTQTTRYRDLVIRSFSGCWLAAILDLIQPEVAPFDPPTSKTLPRSCHLEFGTSGNSAIRSVSLESGCGQLARPKIYGSRPFSKNF